MTTGMPAATASATRGNERRGHVSAAEAVDHDCGRPALERAGELRRAPRPSPYGRSRRRSRRATPAGRGSPPRRGDTRGGACARPPRRGARRRPTRRSKAGWNATSPRSGRRGPRRSGRRPGPRRRSARRRRRRRRRRDSPRPPCRARSGSRIPSVSTTGWPRGTHERKGIGALLDGVRAVRDDHAGAAVVERSRDLLGQRAHVGRRDGEARDRREVGELEVGQRRELGRRLDDVRCRERRQGSRGGSCATHEMVPPTATRRILGSAATTSSYEDYWHGAAGAVDAFSGPLDGAPS